MYRGSKLLAGQKEWDVGMVNMQTADLLSCLSHIRVMSMWMITICLGSFLFILWSHFQFYENVAVASVVNCGLHGFVKSDGDGSEINVLWLNLDDAITSTTDNFQNVLFKRRWGFGLSCVLANKTRSWGKEADRILHVVVYVFGINWNINMIIFFLQGRECGSNLAFFIWE